MGWVVVFPKPPFHFLAYAVPFPHRGFFGVLGLRGPRISGAGMCQCQQKTRLKCRMGAVRASDVGLGHTGGAAYGCVDRKGPSCSQPCNPWPVTQGLSLHEDMLCLSLSLPLSLHKEYVFLWGLPAALPSPEAAFESPFWPPPSNTAGAEEAAVHLMASMEHIRQWDWLTQRSGARQYLERYRVFHLH